MKYLAYPALAGLLFLALLSGGIASAHHGQIGPNELANNAVRSRHILNGVILERDLSAEVQNKLNQQGEQGPQGEQGERGPRGPQGSAGSDGAPGEDGQDGVSGHEVEIRQQDFGPNGVGGSWCDDINKVAIAGGAQFNSTDVANDVAIRAMWPYARDPENEGDRNGWKIQVNAPEGVDPGTVTVYAVCVFAE